MNEAAETVCLSPEDLLIGQVYYDELLSEMRI